MAQAGEHLRAGFEVVTVAEDSASGHQVVPALDEDPADYEDGEGGEEEVLERLVLLLRQIQAVIVQLSSLITFFLLSLLSSKPWKSF